MTRVSLFWGEEHDCSYLPGRVARSAFVDPGFEMDATVYSGLVAQGFRRSGGLVYRPHCQRCSACLPARVGSAQFVPARSQRRNWSRNADLSISINLGQFSDEYFELYVRYQAGRHAGGAMERMSRSECREFLIAPWGVTRCVEFRDEVGKLMAVAVIDVLNDGYSCVYTFFEPDVPDRGLGTFAVLWQLAEARKRRLPWVYLGFWISNCQKMSYKSSFQPLQVFSGGRWNAWEPLGGD